MKPDEQAPELDEIEVIEDPVYPDTAPLEEQRRFAVFAQLALPENDVRATIADLLEPYCKWLKTGEVPPEPPTKTKLKAV
jgi:hypothetical protein